MIRTMSSLAVNDKHDLGRVCFSERTDMEAGMYFPDHAARETKEIAPGIHARTFWGKNLMLVLVTFEENAVVPHHHHPHEQAGQVLEGKVEFQIGEEVKVLGPGDIYLIPGNVPHAAKALNGTARVLDIFHPVREEYK